MEKPSIHWIDGPPNGPVERMNRTVEDKTVKRIHHDDHDRPQRHLDDFRDAEETFGLRVSVLSVLSVLRG